MSESNIVNTTYTTLTTRERFRRQMHYQTIDRGIHWEFGYLGETLDRWHQEGLPADITDGEGPGSVEAYFGVESVAMLPVSLGLQPAFSDEYEVVEKLADSEIRKWPSGLICEVKTEGIRTIPRYLKFPIENRDDWQRFKERLDPATACRHEANWRELAEKMRRETRPVGVWIGSFFGTPRDWVGFENLALMCYDDRELVEEIVETLTQLMLSQLEIALSQVPVDFACGWEDICFRNGPMISPQMFGEIVVPRVRRVTQLLRRHGCDVIWTDCDGDIKPLVPLWLEAGLNCMFPLEVQGGSDPLLLREKYGKQILLRGGLAKFEFAKGHKETLAELKRVEKIFQEGGYIPHGDHRIPEDVSYDNYKYYLHEKLAMMGWHKDDIRGIWPLRNYQS